MVGRNLYGFDMLFLAEKKLNAYRLSERIPSCETSEKPDTIPPAISFPGNRNMAA